MTKDELKQAMLALPKPPNDSKPPFWNYWRRELWKHITSGDDPDEFYKWPCIYHTMLIQRTVAENIDYQCEHLERFQEMTDIFIYNLSSIYEFGGGYGAMAQTTYSWLDFEGAYTIYDLPEFALFQQYYLNRWRDIDTDEINVQWLDKVEQANVDLFIAIYSISECPLELRDEVLEKVKGKAYLFLYSGDWAEYDNVAYFDEFAEKNSHLQWHKWSINDGKDWYLVGS